MPVKVPVSNELIETIGRDELERQLGLAGEIVGRSPADGSDAQFRTIYYLDIPNVPPETEGVAPVFERYQQTDGTWAVRVLTIDCYDANGRFQITLEP